MSWGGLNLQHIFRRPKTHPLSVDGNVQEPSTRDTVPGVSVPARITLFGFDPIDATARIEPRSVRWRLRRTLTALGSAVLLAPLVALVPPHAPWALGALGVGAIVARWKWLELHSLQAVEGICPRCRSDVSLPRATRLRHPHPLPCESCNHELTLEVDPAAGVGVNSPRPSEPPEEA